MANELKIIVRFDTGEAKGNADKLAGGMKAVEGSLKDLENQWKKLEQIARSQYAVGSPQQIKAVNDAALAYKAYQAALTQTQGVVQQTTRVSANASTTLQALNFTIRDSPYFFRDFSLGILAVGNNLNPLIDGLIRMNNEAKAANQTLGQALLGSLKGSAGLIFAFSLLVSVLQAVIFAMAKTKSGAEGLKDSLDLLRGVISELVEFENPFEKFVFPIKTKDVNKLIEATDAEIKKLKEKKEISEAYQFMVEVEYRDKIKITDEEKKKLKANEELLKALEEQKNKLEAQRLISERLKELGIEMTEKSKKSSTKFKEQPDLPNIFDIKPEDYDEFSKFVIKGIEKQEDAFLELELNKYKTQMEYDEKITKWKREQIEDEYEKRIQAIEDVYQKEREQILENKKLGLMSPEQAMDALLSLGQATDTLKGGVKKKRSEEDEAKIKAIDDKLRSAISTANDFGNALFSAFIQGKQGVDEFIKSLLIAIGKMILMNFLTQMVMSIITGGFATPVAGGGKIPELLPGIPRPNFSMSNNTGIPILLRQLEIMNANMALLTPTVVINADTDAVKFTRREINPSQKKLQRGDIRV